MTDKDIHYSIFDPTGNITALVETRVDIPSQPSVAKMLMKRHPEVEQVGFVQFESSVAQETSAGSLDGSLRMAGGEFCGNATMSAAALCLLRKKPEDKNLYKVRLRVSGTTEPTEVRLARENRVSSELSAGSPEDTDVFYAGIHMPPALSITDRKFACGNISGSLPLVRMEGISHIIVEKEKGRDFFFLLHDRLKAEDTLRRWCDELKTDGLGLMFLMDDGPDHHLTPLVYIPGSNTVFWENSCASGSAATGMYLAKRTAGSDTFKELKLVEPGGILKVESHSRTGETWLYGRIRLKGHYLISEWS